MLRLQTCVLQLTWDEVPLGNLNLLLRDVAAYLDDFHTVEQRLRNGAEVVGRCDEEHFREVVVNVEVVVVECRVLLGVEHFKHRRCRVAVDGVLCDLVDFVEDEYRVRRSSLLNRLDDTTGHRSHIGAAMSANLALVVQTTQAHTNILALHSGGNRLAQRCLAYARRAIEADDRTLQVATQLQHGHVF